MRERESEVVAWGVTYREGIARDEWSGVEGRFYSARVFTFFTHGLLQIAGCTLLIEYCMIFLPSLRLLWQGRALTF